MICSVLLLKEKTTEEEAGEMFNEGRVMLAAAEAKSVQTGLSSVCVNVLCLLSPL